MFSLEHTISAVVFGGDFFFEPRIPVYRPIRRPRLESKTLGEKSNAWTTRSSVEVFNQNRCEFIWRSMKVTKTISCFKEKTSLFWVVRVFFGSSLVKQHSNGTPSFSIRTTSRNGWIFSLPMLLYRRVKDPTKKSRNLHLDEVAV